MRLTRDMSITHGEFLLLPPLVAGEAELRVQDRQISIRMDGRDVRITLSPEGRRLIGASMYLPQTIVEFEFRGFDQSALTAFLERFDLYYRRGGG